MLVDAQAALRQWFGNRSFELQPLGAGHINSTWLVTPSGLEAAPAQRFVLQKINQAVFAEPKRLIGNLQQLFPADGLSYALPEPLPTPRGEWLVRAGIEALPDGSEVAGQWRLSAFVERSCTLQRLPSEAHAEAAGRAFGEFQRWLSRLDDLIFAEAIPGFHQLPVYLQALDAAVRVEVAAGRSPSGPAQRLLVQLLERDYVRRSLSKETRTPPHLQTRIHGDCKVNNLLFAQDTRSVVAIVDLDTLMHGPWWLDFGDLVRSATCTDTGEFQREFYPALASGFFAGRFGSSDERVDSADQLSAGLDLDAALRAPAHMTYMLCVRFLTDHLQGDRYFNVAEPGDNLRRAEQQFRLLETLESAETTRFMHGVLAEYLQAR